MITTSTAYKAAVGATSRRTKGKIVFEIVDVTAKSDITSLTVTGEAEISKKAQTYDEERALSAKYATLENDYWKLDDTFWFPPKTAETGYQIGWWSLALSQADKTFAVDQEVLYAFTGNHSSIGITVIFDRQANEYAEDFEIIAYDSSDVEINRDTVTGNILSKYTWEQNLTDYRKIKIIVTKTSTAYRRARITEVDFGIIEEYEGNELINMSVLEECSPNSQEVTMNELRFTIENQDKRFNILNPTGVYDYLQRRQQIFAYNSLEISTDTYEEIPLGVYYLDDWVSNEGTLTASFNANDVMSLLSESKYRKSIYADITLENLAIAVLADVGVTDYSIDSSLSSITVKGYMPILTHREALQMIAVAGECIIYSNRYGVLQIKPANAVATGLEIDFDNVYNTPKITLDKLINTVEVNNYTYTSLASEKVYEGTVALTGTSDVWLDYSKPATGVSYAVTGGATVNSATCYTNSALLNITHTGNTTITLTGTELSLSKSVYQLKDGTAPAGEKDYTMKVDNTLINNTTVASDVATWILAEAKKRNIYDINWRQDPSIEAGDIVTIEDEFGLNYEARITKQEFNWNGALSGSSTGKGASS